MSLYFYTLFDVMTTKKIYFVLCHIFTLMLPNRHSFSVPSKKSNIGHNDTTDFSNNIDKSRSIAIFIQDSEQRNQTKVPNWALWKDGNIEISPRDVSCTQDERDKG